MRKPGGPLYQAVARRLCYGLTATEHRLWAWLRTLCRTHGLHLRRQIPMGQFVADFGCHWAKLIIELGGPFPEAEKDRERDAWFATAGYRTLRLSNEIVARQWDRLVAEIEQALGVGIRLDGPSTYLPQPPTPGPSPRAGGEV